jgi:hypothetical protein
MACDILSFLKLGLFVQKRVLSEKLQHFSLSDLKGRSTLGSFGVEVHFWRNNGFVFGFESGSFLLDR